MRSLKKILAVLMLAALLAGMAPDLAFAAKNDPVKFTVSSTLFVMQGASSYVNVEAAAADDVSYKLTLTCDDKGIVMDNGKSGILSGNAKQTFSFTVNRKAESGYKTRVLRAVDPDDATKILGEQNVYVDVVENINSFSSQGKAAFDVSYSIQGSDTLNTGQNFIKLTLFNRGNTLIRNARVEISMPEGMTIQSGPASRNLGSFSIGDTKSVDYPILVDSSMYSGSYPITVKLTGENAGEDKSAVEAIYVPLTGKEKDQEEEKKDESVPLLVVDSFDYGSTSVMKRDQEFTLKLTFLNTGTKDITKAVINVLDPSGAIVPTETSIIKFDTIKAGEKTNGSVVLRTVKDTDVTSTTLSVDMNYYYEPDHL
ncbi:MAG: hypothetical protein II907_07665 [Firmicutes bacterium]|nr:hypothetical protein [Bacillota bacterium]